MVKMGTTLCIEGHVPFGGRFGFQISAVTVKPNVNSHVQVVVQT